MELNFDKEIDALLRQTARSGTFVGGNGSNSASHIDADAISAFAENALPEKTRALYMTHLADCDRCRKILSNLIVLGTEAASSAEAPGIAIAPVPWYRKLFVFPNLAYTMGALVLVFGGMIGVLVFQNLNNGPTNLSQVSNKEIPATSRPSTDSAASNPANVATNAGNTAALSNSAGTLDSKLQTGMAFNSNSVSGESLSNLPKAPANEVEKYGLQPNAGPTPADPILTERDNGTVTRRDEDDNLKVLDDDQKKRESKEASAKPAPPPPPLTVVGRQAEAAPKKAAPVGGLVLKDERAKMDSEESGKRKRLAGKSFNRSGDVWYDSAYRGQATINVRRSTSEYRKLDSGLRSIADGLQGVVVVVWKEKAYRIE